MKKPVFCALSFLVALLLAVSAPAATYYVSSAGNDSNTGTSTGAPWLTIAKVKATIASGDTILFRGGDTFTGGEITVTFPATFSSYGTGKATIACGTSFGIKATNTGNVSVSYLIFTGSDIIYTGTFPDQTASCANETKAVWFDCDTISTAYPGLVVDNCEISGFWDPIAFWASNLSCQLASTGARVTNNYVHDCLKSGIFFYSEASAPGVASTYRTHVSPVISGNTIYRIPGSDRGMCMWIFNCLDALIERNKCSYNGWAVPGYPVSILVCVSTNTLIRFNDVSHFYTHGGDGEGIDTDIGSVGAIVEYNYLHDSPSPGLFDYKGVDSVFRYNIVERCNGGYKADTPTNSLVYHNTFYAGTYPESSPIVFATIHAYTGTQKYYNNIICANTGIDHIFTDQVTAQFVGNAYERLGGSGFSATIDAGAGPTTYSSLASFRTAGYEKISSTPYGANGPMLFFDAGNGVTQLPSNPVTKLGNYDILNASSAARSVGVTLSGVGITAPTTDWHGNPASITTPDAGALAYGSVAIVTPILIGGIILAGLSP